MQADWRTLADLSLSIADKVSSLSPHRLFFPLNLDIHSGEGTWNFASELD
jgi:hypothetical protein